MPDASARTELRLRARDGETTARASSREVSAAARPRVIGGLMSGQPERAVLVKAATSVARLELVDNRLALVSRVLATRPAVLVLPPFDAARTSTAPLVRRVRREAPGVAIVVITCHPAGAGQPILRAVQAGALVIPSATAEELRETLVGLLGG